MYPVHEACQYRCAEKPDIDTFSHNATEENNNTLPELGRRVAITLRIHKDFDTCVHKSIYKKSDIEFLKHRKWRTETT